MWLQNGWSICNYAVYFLLNRSNFFHFSVAAKREQFCVALIFCWRRNCGKMVSNSARQSCRGIKSISSHIFNDTLLHGGRKACVTRLDRRLVVAGFDGCKCAFIKVTIKLYALTVLSQRVQLVHHGRQDAVEIIVHDGLVKVGPVHVC